MPPDLVIGLDSSTSATKAIAWTARGEAVAEARSPLRLDNPRPGWFEQDPADWWRSAAEALRGVTAAVGASRVAALAVANQRETFALLHGDGRAVRPGTLWLDERARAQERRFGQTFGATRVHAISGKPLDVIACLYRILWHREEEPDHFAAAEMMADVDGFLLFHLTGRWITSTASADPMGLLDMQAMAWSPDILAALGVGPERLPALARPGEVVGTVTEGAARATGLSPGTPVVAGGGDGQCAGTGAGLLAPGRAYVNLGTAVVSGSHGASYAYDRAFRTEVAVADGGYVYETCLRAGTFLVDWFARELFGLPPDGLGEGLRALETEAAQSPIGAGGVMLAPYWQGVMNPHWDSLARGALVGLSGSSRRGDVYRGLLEGIALEQATATDEVQRATGLPIEHYVAVGGGAASTLWMEILADCAGRPVHRSATVEASSLGAAMAAARGAGWFGSIAEAADAMAAPIVSTVAPDPGRAARYRELKAIHADLWPTLSAWNRRLAAFTEAGDRPEGRA